MAPHKISPPSTPVSHTSSELEPSLPRPDCCLSWWQKTTRAFPYLNANANERLPASSQYVIIGSGISGALTAYSLVHDSGVPGSNIVILEAREAVSGASGRNAGHVRPDAFRGFQGYARIHGAEQALKIIANEKLVFERIDQFVKTHNIACDFNPTTTFDVCLTEDFARYEAESFRAYVDAGGDASHVQFYEGEDAKTRTRVPDAVAAYEWPAGSSHPAKLAQWLLSKSIEAGVRLFTHTPVVDVVGESDEWRVQTNRGSMLAEKVVHCTNAYSAALLPQLSRFVTPNKAQAHSVIPNHAFSGDGMLGSTMSLRYSMHHFYSLIQREGDGTFILGVSRNNPKLSAATKAEIVSFDDSKFNQEIVENAIREFGQLFPDTAGKQRHGEGLDYAWTGIIGMTPDSVPLVGAIKELPGQYICAGFNGHGMARIFTCAPGVVKIMMGANWDETGLPECFEYSADRLSRALQKSQAGSVW